MKFLIDLKTLEITPLAQGVSWGQIKGVTSNGQHPQLAGTVLVEYRPSEDEIILLHPETDPSTGHQDLIYSGGRRKWGGKISFQTYTRQEITNLLSDEIYRFWPNGPEHLIQTVIVIENYLKNEVGYTRTLLRHLVANFK